MFNLAPSICSSAGWAGSSWLRLAADECLELQGNLNGRVAAGCARSQEKPALRDTDGAVPGWELGEKPVLVSVAGCAMTGMEMTTGTVMTRKGKAHTALPSVHMQQDKGN